MPCIISSLWVRVGLGTHPRIWQVCHSYGYVIICHSHDYVIMYIDSSVLLARIREAPIGLGGVRCHATRGPRKRATWQETLSGPYLLTAAPTDSKNTGPSVTTTRRSILPVAWRSLEADLSPVKPLMRPQPLPTPGWQPYETLSLAVPGLLTYRDCGEKNVYYFKLLGFW